MSALSNFILAHSFRDGTLLQVTVKNRPNVLFVGSHHFLLLPISFYVVNFCRKRLRGLVALTCFTLAQIKCKKYDKFANRSNMQHEIGQKCLLIEVL
jgi:hypothetical protein